MYEDIILIVLLLIAAFVTAIVLQIVC
jgi:hypothetical protein